MHMGVYVTLGLAVIHSQRDMAFPLGLGKKVTGFALRGPGDDTSPGEVEQILQTQKQEFSMSTRMFLCLKVVG